jgi:hypothetical protein
VIGSWVINGEFAGIRIREENSIVFKKDSRILPIE